MRRGGLRGVRLVFLVCLAVREGVEDALEVAGENDGAEGAVAL